jgi:surface antigen
MSVARSAILATVVVLGLSPVTGAAAQTYGADNGACDRGALANVFSTSQNNLIGSGVGAAAGGLVGSKFGGGSGQTVMTVAGILAGALAGGAIGRSMEPVDHGCIGRTLEHSPSKHTVAWKNPDSDSSYWVTPNDAYQRKDGTACRHYQTTGLIEGQRQHLKGTACRQPDGSWKVQR